MLSVAVVAALHLACAGDIALKRSHEAEGLHRQAQRLGGGQARSKVRKALPKDFAYVIEELITEKEEIQDKEASARDDIKANLQVDLILLLDEFGYPPVTIDDVYKEVLEQAENFKKYAQ